MQLDLRGISFNFGALRIMRNVFRIRKFFWLINSVLLAILVHIVVSFIPGNNAGKSTFAYPIPIKEKVEIMPCMNDLPPVNHKIIIERNIFGSSGLSPAKEKLQRKNSDAPTSVIRAQFRLLATIAGDDQVACAVIENLKSKVQDIYKTGDIINGIQIERIYRNKVFLFYEGQREVLNLRITCSVLDPIKKKEETIIETQEKTAEFVKVFSPVKREISKKDSTTQVQGMHMFLEKMEVTPYIINGEEKGLRIAGLDDSSLASYVGFENGDVIQTLNGQMLTDKQKAFQVFKKARSQSSLNFQLLRNQHKMDLSFEIK